MADGEIQLCKNVLVDWTNKDRKAFMDSVQCLISSTGFTLDSVTDLASSITKIVKEIHTNKDDQYDGYLEQILLLKSKLKEKETLLKKRENNQSKKDKDGNKLDSKDKSASLLPESFGKDLDEKRRNYAKFLFNIFLQNFPEKFDQKTLEKFIIDVEQEIFDLCAGSDLKIVKQLGSLKINLQSSKSVYAKKEMLEGKISPKEVASNKTSVFEDKSLGKKGEEYKEKEVKLTGDGEECIKCHAMEAYCYSMQQIRASDEPMTRFIQCRACKDTWTD